MLSFRSELENLNNPIIENDIIDLADKIAKFKNLKIDEEKFRALRLARGVYGQRQPGVQMVRIKIPYGKMSFRQLRRIADLSDEYASSKLHATTRQDIQIHYVSLDKTPELWAKLEQDNITLREACGNTVRNVTASDKAGIDPNEPFDVSPYAHAIFEYFLRNPVCQEMGRKFKIALSSSEEDSAFTFIHDVGIIPKIRIENGREIRGFKVYIGGGLGAQPFLAKLAYEFLGEDQLIPFIEGVLRVFDRFGERARRQKARLKFLLNDLGLEALLRLVAEEQKALKVKTFKVDHASFVSTPKLPEDSDYSSVKVEDVAKFEKWLETNVFEQKQKGYYGVYIKLLLGDMSSDLARRFADIAEKYAADDIRITVNQGYLLKFIRKDALKPLFNELNRVGLAEPGFDSPADITACPGTDTCNLGISSSTGLAKALEEVIKNEYPDLIHNNDLKIKISGCPNSCGQHGMASIGFHGSSMKNGLNVLPAVQVMLGGGVNSDGEGEVAERVVKVPSKKAPDTLRTILDDYDANGNDGEYFKDYFKRQGKMYFYNLLKPLANLNELNETDYIDWGREHKFVVQTAVGECAGVIIDLVSTLLFDSDEKLEWAKETLSNGLYSDSVYHSYNVFVNSAKAMLLGENVKNNSHMSVINDFDRIFVETGTFNFIEGSFKEHVLQISKNEPTEEFASEYFKRAKAFLNEIRSVRNSKVAEAV
ncbi:MAG: HEPN domain-containing protein [Cytophagales bacterium]|nr:HEPN domain-containing protein [Cytophagales bacterium]